jgi:hypothetical protein
MQKHLHQVYDKKIKLQLLIRTLVSLSFLLFFFHISYAQQEINLTIVSFKNKEPIPNILIFTSKQTLLTVSDKKGKCRFKLSPDSVLLLKKLGIKDTLIKYQPNIDTVFLKNNFIQLSEVVILPKNFNAKKYLMKLVKNTKQFLVHHDTILFYSLQYNISSTDSNWNETLSGIFKVKIRDYKNISFYYREVNVCEIYYYPLQQPIDSTTYNKFFQTNIRSFFSLDFFERGTIFFWKFTKKNTKLIQKDSSIVFNYKHYLKKESGISGKMIFTKYGIIKEVNMFDPSYEQGYKNNSKYEYYYYSIKYSSAIPLVPFSIYTKGKINYKNNFSYTFEYIANLVEPCKVKNCLNIPLIYTYQCKIPRRMIDYLQKQAPQSKQNLIHIMH